MEYLLSYGLGGSFGGATNHVVEDLSDETEALEYAEELARNDYESYEGMHGLLSYYDVQNQLKEENDEEDVDGEDVDEAYREEVERWIVFSAVPYNEDEHSYLL